MFARKTAADLNAERPLGDVFFDYDSRGRQAGRPERAATECRVADTMAHGPGCGGGALRLERHVGYNLALGDRRASAAKNYLVSLGVPADRVAVVTGRARSRHSARRRRKTAGSRTAGATSSSSASKPPGAPTPHASACEALKGPVQLARTA
ncbi:MAG: hypothetical protein MZV64_14005 [Ignavibacteriales bacterium]|nr:hypothetical protein [Ignavibacteriales bacterium]